jgi:prolyl oligopeptidase
MRLLPDLGSTALWTILALLSCFCGNMTAEMNAAEPTDQLPTLKYPQTKTVAQVDDYHGLSVADPYRWLEDDVRESNDVAQWVEAQNQVTQQFLGSIPQRAAINQRLTKLWNYERYSAPSKQGNEYVFSKNDGLQNQAVVYVQPNLKGTPRVLLDPNLWTKDGTIALAGLSFSDSGKLVAYAQSASGSDWTTWKVMEVATGKQLTDEVKWVKSSGATWTKDEQGFFYGRYDIPADGAAFQQKNLNHKLFYHKLGTPQSDDQLVMERPDFPTWVFHADVTEDGRYLFVVISKGTDDKYRIMYRDQTQPNAPFVELINNFDHGYDLIGNDGSVCYFRTDRDAPRKRIIAIDLTKPDVQNWKELIPQTQDTLVGASYVGGYFFVQYLHDAQSLINVHDRTGKFVRTVDLPGIGSAGGFGGKQNATETFYSFSSYTTPPSIYRYEIATGKSELLRTAKVDFDPAQFETKQVFYTSRDGTKVPMFITSKKGIKLDGNNPTLLYGYGGFNIPLTPSFAASRLVWLEQGGIYVVANLRGGGEYGEEWHKAGTKLNKQNVFDDFIGAAEYLIANKYTSAPKLAIQGGSNGGLLVGACMTQRPELFGACLPAVGVMDMLRFHQFTVGRFWVDDYGSSDNPIEFHALHQYSPLHNLKPGTKYPATMVITADTDDRVVPSHSFKFAAALQAAQAGPAPTIIRIETKAGHGAGKPTTKLIEEATDQYAFLVKVLGMKY